MNVLSNERIAEPTPTKAEDVAASIARSYESLMGQPPPRRESWLWPLALSANETASWTSIYNWNVGNVTSLGSVPWYRNPKVTADLKFRAYGSLDEGTAGMLQVLKTWGGLTAADAADLPAFQRACNKYLGGTYPDLSGLIARLSSTTEYPTS